MEHKDFIEVTFPDWPEAPEIPEGMKRVEVQIYWRWEDTKTYDIPEDTELDDVREEIVFNVDDHFDFSNAWLTEFEVWNIQTEDGDQEWWM